MPQPYNIKHIEWSDGERERENKYTHTDCI